MWNDVIQGLLGDFLANGELILTQNSQFLLMKSKPKSNRLAFVGAMWNDVI